MLLTVGDSPLRVHALAVALKSMNGQGDEPNV
jgi:hypothetical protein